jgi:ABC-type transport system involved in cytochrome c biogenesis permease subunit
MNWIEWMEFFILGLYFCGAVLHIVAILTRRPVIQRLGQILIITGFGLHTLDMLLSLTKAGAQVFGQVPFYFSLLAWTLIVVYLVLSWRLQTHFLGLTATPLALILFSFATTLNSVEVVLPERLLGLWVGLHIVTLFLSICLLAMATSSGIVYLYLENKIKAKAKITGLSKDLPSLALFDKVNAWAVSIGFPFFTVGLLSGFLWAHSTREGFFVWDPKQLAATIIWLLFAVLFHKRLISGWRGRKPAKLAIWIFCLSLVFMLGINFFLEPHNSFQPQ